MADILMRYGFEEMGNYYDAEHCAGSLYAVLEALWKSRTEIIKQKSKPRK
jgi:hypothetical protein